MILERVAVRSTNDFGKTDAEHDRIIERPRRRRTDPAPRRHSGDRHARPARRGRRRARAHRLVDNSVTRRSPVRRPCDAARFLASTMVGEKRARGSVAVVIPCFNDGATLVDAVASAQSQDVPAEIIVVDDGSTDHATIALTELLEADGIRVIRQVNEGPAPARMAGVRATERRLCLPARRRRPHRTARPRATDRRSRPQPGRGCSVGLDPELRPPRARAPQPADARPVAGQLPEPPSDLLALPAQAAARRGRLAASRRLRGLGPLDVARRAGLEGHRHPRGDRALPGAERPTAVAVVAGATRSASTRFARAIRSLFAARGRNRRSSPAPRLLKIALPTIDALPLSPTRKRLLGGAVTHVSYGNGVGTLVARYRAHRLLRAQRVLKGAPWCASPGSLARPRKPGRIAA